jgi:glycosyltransferase involved in cell wall biosynthesis
VTHSYYLRDTRPRRHAEALAGAGFEVEVLCAREPGDAKAETHRGVLIRRLPSRRERGGKVRYVFEYATFIAMAAVVVGWLHVRRRYSVVWILSIPNAMVFAGIVPRLLGTPVVIDVRDPMPEFFQSKYGVRGGSRLMKALLAEEKASLRFASRVVTVHEPLREALLRTGVDRDRTHVVMNAPDLGLLLPDRSRHEPHDRTLLYAGTVAARYGVDVALEAVAQLTGEIPAIRLRVVGDGDLSPKLARRGATLGIADRLSLDGPVPFTEIPGIVGSSWVGVQPHRSDPLMAFSVSTKILEWCALGLPVVAPRTPGLLHFFGEDDLWWMAPGSLEDLCGRLLEIHKDPEAAAERAARARETALARFDWERERRGLVELVKALAR